MLLRYCGALLLAASSALALNDASPFFMLSDQPLNHADALPSQQIATANDVEEGVLKTLEPCSQSFYFLVSQPGVTVADLQDAKFMPKLKKRVASAGDGITEVPQVLGGLENQKLAQRIAATCDIQEIEETYGTPATSLNRQAAVVRINLSVDKDTTEQDGYLDSIIANATKGNKPYVLIYTSTPDLQSQKQHLPYEMDEPYPSALHTDLKRDLQHHKRHMHGRRQSNGTGNTQANLPLFETYQFLSPSIFMGLSVTLLLVLILYVGVSAIAGLEVSYMAFSKEMGPQAQNKGKQQ